MSYSVIGCNRRIGEKLCDVVIKSFHLQSLDRPWSLNDLSRCASLLLVARYDSLF